LIGCASGKPASISAQDLVQGVAAGELVEAVALQRVHGDVEAVDPGAHELLGVASQEEAVGGDRQVVDPVDRGDHPGQRREVAADQRLAAGEPDVADAHLGKQGHQARDLLEGEDLGALEPGQALGGHAVLAAEVAAVGDRDPQVSDVATVAVSQRLPGASGSLAERFRNHPSRVALPR
jgi:hypothetical protein